MLHSYEGKASPVTQTVKNVGGFDPWFDSWSRKWQLTPVFLPGEFHGQRILADYT